MKFIFIRHGKDNEKYRGGWSALDLTDEGITQAKKLANYLNKINENMQIKKFITSDLKRAVTTTAIANNYLQLPVELEPLLREINNGDLAGMLNDEVIKKYPGLFFNTLDMTQKYPNGESPIEFFERINKWFNFAKEKYMNDDGAIAIVTHSGVINIIYYIVKKKEWSNKVKSFKISNCSIHILDLDTMNFDVENLNEFLK